MKLYRFSPIQNEEELLEAVKHVHFECFKLCKQSFGKYFPVAGNIGIFCHYNSEYKYLTEVREKLTDPSESINQKYFLLHNPIVIPASGDIPETRYTHLYIRKPDIYRSQVGDVDFVIGDEEYIELKNQLSSGVEIKGARIFDRADLDMVELYDPDVDALGYISPKEETEKVRFKVMN
ncbi:MAG: hypothetical protein ACKOW9_04170 [Candidatus Paceibacterota bacterium]